MKLRNFFRYWLPAIVWILLVLAASSDMMSAEHTSRFLVPFLRWITPHISAETVAAVQLAVRKSAHLAEYALLAALLLRALRGEAERFQWGHVAFTLAFALACAVSDEFHQSLVASRTGSPVDVIIDMLGAISGVALYWWWRERRARREVAVRSVERVRARP